MSPSQARLAIILGALSVVLQAARTFMHYRDRRDRRRRGPVVTLEEHHGNLRVKEGS